MLCRIIGAALVGLTACDGGGATITTEEHPAIQIVEARPGLAAQATISGSDAITVALNRVPNGDIVEAELEEENGSLVYSFDLRIPGTEGIEEVLVDAHTGNVVSVEHENEEHADEDGPGHSDEEDEGHDNDHEGHDTDHTGA